MPHKKSLEKRLTKGVQNIELKKWVTKICDYVWRHNYESDVYQPKRHIINASILLYDKYTVIRGSPNDTTGRFVLVAMCMNLIMKFFNSDTAYVPESSEWQKCLQKEQKVTRKYLKYVEMHILCSSVFKPREILKEVLLTDSFRDLKDLNFY